MYIKYKLGNPALPGHKVFLVIPTQLVLNKT